MESEEAAMTIDYKTRLMDERAELDIKIVKLASFISSKAFWDLSELKRSQLQQQVRWMHGYNETLRERISTDSIS